MNQIPSKQNEDLAIKRLAAQRALYSRAKILFALQLFLNVPLMVMLAALALALDKEWGGLPKVDIAWVIGAVGVSFLLLDVLVWNIKINAYREQAAKIQQAFDCDVLEMQADEIIYGKAPDKEDVEEWSKVLPADQLSELKDWYRPEVATLPIDAARLICQRSNCWWDMDIRRRYNWTVGISAALFVSAMIGIAVGLDCSTKTVFGLIVAPILPFLTMAIKLIQDNNDAIVRLRTMKEAIEAMWDRLIMKNVADADLKDFSERIQVGIFTNRKNNPLIFDWMHKRLRPKHETTTSRTTVEYVTDYVNSRRP